MCSVLPETLLTFSLLKAWHYYEPSFENKIYQTKLIVIPVMLCVHKVHTAEWISSHAFRTYLFVLQQTVKNT